MNRLQLVQKAITECGVSGTITTALNLTGSQGRIAGWIDQAWEELQTAHDDWGWMRSSNLLGGGVSFITVAGQAYYPLGTVAGTVGVAVASFSRWIPETFRNYPTAVGISGEVFLYDISYDRWRDGYMYGAMRTVQTRPVAVAIGPDRQLCLGPPPAAGYTITGDYYTAPTTMVADADVPTGLDADFHIMLVYKAMEYYASYESAPEVYQRSQKGYNPLIAKLEALRLEEVTTCGALA